MFLLPSVKQQARGPHNNKNCVVETVSPSSMRCAKIVINLIWFMMTRSRIVDMHPRKAIRNDHNKAGQFSMLSSITHDYNLQKRKAQMNK